jgi:hypothetical protein
MQKTAKDYTFYNNAQRVITVTAESHQEAVEKAESTL